MLFTAGMRLPDDGFRDSEAEASFAEWLLWLLVEFRSLVL